MEFRNSVVGYFNSLNRSPAMARPSDGEESGKYRREINLAVAEVRSIVRASGRAARVVWTPPPAIGGPSRSVELLDDIFLLDRYDIPPSMVVDELDRVMGVYETDRRNSIFRTFNPLWWIGNLAGWLVRLPFRAIGAAGFDADKAEASVPGRIAKVVLYTATIAAALLTILDLLGWLDTVKRMVESGL